MQSAQDLAGKRNPLQGSARSRRTTQGHAQQVRVTPKRASPKGKPVRAEAALPQGGFSRRCQVKTSVCGASSEGPIEEGGAVRSAPPGSDAPQTRSLLPDKHPRRNDEAAPLTRAASSFKNDGQAPSAGRGKPAPGGRSCAAPHAVGPARCPESQRRVHGPDPPVPCGPYRCGASSRAPQAPE